MRRENAEQNQKEMLHMRSPRENKPEYGIAHTHPHLQKRDLLLLQPQMLRGASLKVEGEEKNMKQTSLDSFIAIKRELPKRRAEVLRAVEELGGSASSFQVAERLGLPLHSISGRITELQKSGHLVDSGERQEKMYRKRQIKTSFIVWRMV